MFEERKATISNQHPIKDSEQNQLDPAQRSDQDRRAVHIQRMMLVGVIVAVISIGFYASLYTQTNAWQILADVAGIVLGIICLIPALVQARRQKLDAAGYWMLFALVIVYGVGELVWADVTRHQVASFIFLVILMGGTVRPRRWGVWLATVLLYGVYVFSINQFEPLSRYDILELSPAIQLVNIPLALLVVWQTIRAVRLGTIRARLIIAFMSVALLSVVAVIGMLLVDQSQYAVLEQMYTLLAISGGAMLFAILAAIIASLLVARGITVPLAKLTEAASQIADGNMESVAQVERDDEIGQLAQTFNRMAGQLRELIGGLEQRVTERTRELEQRSAYMEASADVGRAVSSILDADQLIQQVVELIRERFGLYYVGLFLTDEASEWAVLRAGTGDAGKAMLARNHRLKIGLEGMIGWSIANAKARVALYAEEDIVRKVIDELPETRSEAALPLRSRGRVLGALTIQHDQFNAFDDDAIAVLQTMADQVAVALDNARLFTESQAALDATRRIYSELRREAWSELLRTQVDLGYRSHAGGVTPVGDVWRADMEQALQEGKTIQGNGTSAEEMLPLTVPIKVRGEVIGVLDTHKPVGAGGWTSEEISLLETLVEQLGEAMEGARLYQDTQRRAARERLTREITDKMRRATSVEGIVQVAVDELFDIMKTSRTFVRLETALPVQDTNDKKK
ncbi:MAG: GAF domain-containing protein [Chloroflexi bacterium]|nr:GAF domain-containing protein [Chloroflexota bacterium]